MNSDETRSFLEDVFERWHETGDMNVWLDVLSDDLVWTVAGSSPTSGKYEGKQAYQDGVLSKLSEWLTENPVPTLRKMIVEDDWASVLLHATARSKDGKEFGMDYCWIIHVANHQVSEVIGFYA